LSPPSLTPNLLIQVNNSTPFKLLTPSQGNGRERKIQEISNRTPQLQRAVSAPSPLTEYNFQPTGFVRDEDAGNRFARTDQFTSIRSED
jgi:hypothetical protein